MEKGREMSAALGSRAAENRRKLLGKLKALRLLQLAAEPLFLDGRRILLMDFGWLLPAGESRNHWGAPVLRAPVLDAEAPACWRGACRPPLLSHIVAFEAALC